MCFVWKAKPLCKLEVITRYTTSASYLEDGVDGVIVAMDNAECAEGIVNVLHNSKQMKQLSESFAQKEYTNPVEMRKFTQLSNENNERTGII